MKTVDGMYFIPHIDAMKTVGISCHDADRDNLKALGLADFDIVTGTDAVSEYFSCPGTLRDGLTIVLPREDALANRAAHRAARLILCADNGVLVQVADGDPVLYNSDDAITEFRARSVAVQRANGARQRAKAGRVGRPPSVAISDEHKAAVCAVWWDDRLDGGKRAIELAVKLTGSDKVTLSHVKGWCSPTRTKPVEPE